MASPTEFIFSDNSIQVGIDVRVHSLSAVKKTAYRLADRSTVVLGSIADEILPVTFRFRPSTAEATAQETVRLFFQELLDQDLREEIGEQTAPLRSLILAHAFSNADLIRRE